MITTEFRCQTKYGMGVVCVGFYGGNDGIAISLVDDTSMEPLATCTVNLVPYGSRPLLPNEVWLKGWSGNEGLPEALEEAGVLKLTGETMPTGFVTAQLAILDPKIMEQTHHD